MYTFQVTDNPPMCTVLKGDEIYDYSGPWESVEAATNWAQAFVAQLNGELE